MMKCPSNIIELMHDYLDEDISPQDEIVLREHLNECVKCSQHFNDLKKTVAFIQHSSHLAPSDDFTAKVMARLPKEKKVVQLGRWLRKHPFITAASLFFALMVGSLFTAWSGEQQFSVSTKEDLIIKGNTVIVPEGEVVKGDIVVRNGSIKIEGKVDGNVTIIHGEKYLASAGQVTGEIEEINEVFEWIWYNIKKAVKDTYKTFESE
jgi:anti-sigma factor RsiW